MTIPAATTNVIPIGGNRIEYLKRQIIDGHARLQKNSADWVEASLQTACALREARDAIPADISFNVWLKRNALDFFNRTDRAALINMAGNPELMRTILSATDSRSYQLIWRESKRRFHIDMKPSAKRSRRPTRNMTRAMNYRIMKLGQDVIDQIKGTSLDSQKEMDELIMLNRGAPEGELTEIVKRLVADAVTGKPVSAVAEGARLSGKPAAPLASLIAAWNKRMTATWEQADYATREGFVSYLIEHIKRPPS
jgi:hypothetical protein